MIKREIIDKKEVRRKNLKIKKSVSLLSIVLKVVKSRKNIKTVAIEWMLSTVSKVWSET